jgi:hypothetical protein
MGCCGSKRPKEYSGYREMAGPTDRPSSGGGPQIGGLFGPGAYLGLPVGRRSLSGGTLA